MASWPKPSLRVENGRSAARLSAAAKAPPAVGSRVIVFCLDGAGYPQMMEAIRSGKAPHIAALLGKEQGGGVFEHGYSAPGALSVLPSSTVADWGRDLYGKAAGAKRRAGRRMVRPSAAALLCAGANHRRRYGRFLTDARR